MYSDSYNSRPAELVGRTPSSAVGPLADGSVVQEL